MRGDRRAQVAARRRCSMVLDWTRPSWFRWRNAASGMARSCSVTPPCGFLLMPPQWRSLSGSRRRSLRPTRSRATTRRSTGSRRRCRRRSCASITTCPESFSGTCTDLRRSQRAWVVTSTTSSLSRVAGSACLLATSPARGSMPQCSRRSSSTRSGRSHTRIPRRQESLRRPTRYCWPLREFPSSPRSYC